MDQLFDTGEPPRGRTAVPPEHGPLAARMRPRTLDEVVGQEHVLGAGHARCAPRSSRGGRTRWSSTGRPARARRRSRGSSPRPRAPRSRSSAPSRPGAPRCARCSSAPTTAARARASRRSSSSTRSTASTRPSRTRCCPRSRRASSRSSGRRPRTRTSRSTRRCSRARRSTSCARSRRPTSRCCCAGRSTAASAATHAVGDDVARRSSPARAGGDARTALAALELACETAADGEPITLERAEDALQRRALTYDKKGDRHYDTISAWIKATRGSDPDASLYYLAVMLEGGEDPRFIVRRMVDPRLRGRRQRRPAGAAGRGRRGPRRRARRACPRRSYALAQCAIYLALAPKSNAADARARPRAGARPRARRPAAAAVPAERRLPGRRAARPRPGLRLPARQPGPGRAPGAAARRGRRGRGSTSPPRPRGRSPSASRPSGARGAAEPRRSGPWRGPSG